MANAVYPKFFEHICQAEIDFRTAVFKAVLMNGTYVYDDTHEFKSSLTGILATVTLTGVSYTDGVIDFDDAQFTTPGGPDDQVVIYVDTGSPTTSPLFMFF